MHTHQRMQQVMALRCGMRAWPTHLINCSAERKVQAPGWPSGGRSGDETLPVARMPPETLGVFSSARLPIPALKGLRGPSHPCGGSSHPGLHLELRAFQTLLPKRPARVRRAQGARIYFAALLTLCFRRTRPRAVEREKVGQVRTARHVVPPGLGHHQCGGNSEEAQMPSKKDRWSSGANA